MTPRCPHRHYRTERYARRQAWSLDENPETRPTPVLCECGSGAWRLAEHDPGGMSAADTSNDQQPRS